MYGPEFVTWVLLIGGLVALWMLTGGDDDEG